MPNTANRIVLYDTTLRDGCQSEDVSFTLEDKLRITEQLDDCGIRYIEGGWPGSNPRDEAYFAAASRLPLRQARIVAFGSTRRANVAPSEDLNLRFLLQANTAAVTVVGKAWSLQVRDDLRISAQANLDLIADSIRYLKQRVDEVFFDAEHFFDGYQSDQEYALACLKAAAEAGADALVLCDTRGGRVPGEIKEAVAAVARSVSTPLGIHCHNDCELAVANTLAAVEGGATQVQGTINGFGERCGNANLCSVVPNLQLKQGRQCVSDAQLQKLTSVSNMVYTLANLEPFKRHAYVGESAFAHKGGLHVAAVQKNSETYEHIDPALVGNRQRVLISDLSGRGSIFYKCRQFGVDLDRSDPALGTVLAKVKELEAAGFQYECAEASLELLIKDVLRGETRHFRVVEFRVSDEKLEGEGSTVSEATIKVAVLGGHIEHATARGNGPLNALDTALREALRPHFPQFDAMRLLDYKVRVLYGGVGSDACVRVLIQSGDEGGSWGTVGVSSNLIEASLQALVDSIEFMLLRQQKRLGSEFHRSTVNG